jgi:DNA-binding HxlR family transcriptional regulator
MLSKELRELEMNELIKRTEYDTKPVTEMAPYGKSLYKLLLTLNEWRVQHLKRIMKKK